MKLKIISSIIFSLFLGQEVLAAPTATTSGATPTTTTGQSTTLPNITVTPQAEKLWQTYVESSKSEYDALTPTQQQALEKFFLAVASQPLDITTAEGMTNLGENVLSFEKIYNASSGQLNLDGVSFTLPKNLTSALNRALDGVIFKPMLALDESSPDEVAAILTALAKSPDDVRQYYLDSGEGLVQNFNGALRNIIGSSSGFSDFADLYSSTLSGLAEFPEPTDSELETQYKALVAQNIYRAKQRTQTQIANITKMLANGSNAELEAELQQAKDKLSLYDNFVEQQSLTAEMDAVQVTQAKAGIASSLSRIDNANSKINSFESEDAKTTGAESLEISIQIAAEKLYIQRELANYTQKVAALLELNQTDFDLSSLPESLRADAAMQIAQQAKSAISSLSSTDKAAVAKQLNDILSPAIDAAIDNVTSLEAKMKQPPVTAQELMSYDSALQNLDDLVQSQLTLTSASGVTPEPELTAEQQKSVAFAHAYVLLGTEDGVDSIQEWLDGAGAEKSELQSTINSAIEVRTNYLSEALNDTQVGLNIEKGKTPPDVAQMYSDLTTMLGQISDIDTLRDTVNALNAKAEGSFTTPEFTGMSTTELVSMSQTMLDTFDTVTSAYDVDGGIKWNELYQYGADLNAIYGFIQSNNLGSEKLSGSEQTVENLNQSINVSFIKKIGTVFKRFETMPGREIVSNVNTLFNSGDADIVENILQDPAFIDAVATGIINAKDSFDTVGNANLSEYLSQLQTISSGNFDSDDLAKTFASELNSAFASKATDTYNTIDQLLRTYQGDATENKADLSGQLFSAIESYNLITDLQSTDAATAELEVQPETPGKAKSFIDAFNMVASGNAADDYQSFLDSTESSDLDKQTLAQVMQDAMTVQADHISSQMQTALGSSSADADTQVYNLIEQINSLETQNAAIETANDAAGITGLSTDLNIDLSSTQLDSAISKASNAIDSNLTKLSTATPIDWQSYADANAQISELQSFVTRVQFSGDTVNTLTTKMNAAVSTLANSLKTLSPADLQAALDNLSQLPDETQQMILGSQEIKDAISANLINTEANSKLSGSDFEALIGDIQKLDFSQKSKGTLDTFLKTTLVEALAEKKVSSLDAINTALNLFQATNEVLDKATAEADKYNSEISGIKVQIVQIEEEIEYLQEADSLTRSKRALLKSLLKQKTELSSQVIKLQSTADTYNAKQEQAFKNKFTAEENLAEAVSDYNSIVAKQESLATATATEVPAIDPENLSGGAESAYLFSEAMNFVNADSSVDTTEFKPKLEQWLESNESSYSRESLIKAMGAALNAKAVELLTDSIKYNFDAQKFIPMQEIYPKYDAISKIIDNFNVNYDTDISTGFDDLTNAQQEALLAVEKEHILPTASPKQLRIEQIEAYELQEAEQQNAEQQLSVIDRMLAAARATAPKTTDVDFEQAELLSTIETGLDAQKTKLREATAQLRSFFTPDSSPFDLDTLGSLDLSSDSAEIDAFKQALMNVNSAASILSTLPTELDSEIQTQTDTLNNIKPQYQAILEAHDGTLPAINQLTPEEQQVVSEYKTLDQAVTRLGVIKNGVLKTSSDGTTSVKEDISIAQIKKRLGSDVKFELAKAIAKVYDADPTAKSIKVDAVVETFYQDYVEPMVTNINSLDLATATTSEITQFREQVKQLRAVQAMQLQEKNTLPISSDETLDLKIQTAFSKSLDYELSSYSANNIKMQTLEDEYPLMKGFEGLLSPSQREKLMEEMQKANPDMSPEQLDADVSEYQSLSEENTTSSSAVNQGVMRDIETLNALTTKDPSALSDPDSVTAKTYKATLDRIIVARVTGEKVLWSGRDSIIDNALTSADAILAKYNMSINLDNFSTLSTAIENVRTITAQLDAEADSDEGINPASEQSYVKAIETLSKTISQASADKIYIPMTIKSDVATILKAGQRHIQEMIAQNTQAIVDAEQDSQALTVAGKAATQDLMLEIFTKVLENQALESISEGASLEIDSPNTDTVQSLQTKLTGLLTGLSFNSDTQDSMEQKYNALVADYVAAVGSMESAADTPTYTQALKDLIYLGTQIQTYQAHQESVSTFTALKNAFLRFFGVVSVGDQLKQEVNDNLNSLQLEQPTQTSSLLTQDSGDLATAADSLEEETGSSKADSVYNDLVESVKTAVSAVQDLAKDFSGDDAQSAALADDVIQLQKQVENLKGYQSLLTDPNIFRDLLAESDAIQAQEASVANADDADSGTADSDSSGAAEAEVLLNDAESLGSLDSALTGDVLAADSSSGSETDGSNLTTIQQEIPVITISDSDSDAEIAKALDQLVTDNIDATLDVIASLPADSSTRAGAIDKIKSAITALKNLKSTMASPSTSGATIDAGLEAASKIVANADLSIGTTVSDSLSTSIDSGLSEVENPVSGKTPAEIAAGLLHDAPPLPEPEPVSVDPSPDPDE